MVVLWLPPGIEQLTTSPGNVVQVYRFVSTHPSDQTLETSLEAAGTVFGSFPLRTGERSGTRDADPAWLVKRPIWERPWYLAYILLTIGAAALAVLRRQRQALALAATSCMAILAAGWSVGAHLRGAIPIPDLLDRGLVVPAWVACWLALAPAPRPVPGRRASAFLGFAARNRWSRLSVPLASLAAAATVSTAFVVYPFPMTGATSALGRRSWQAVSAGVLAPRVKVLYIDIVSPDAMPEAAAIADQARAARAASRGEPRCPVLPGPCPSPRRRRPQVRCSCAAGDRIPAGRREAFGSAHVWAARPSTRPIVRTGLHLQAHPSSASRPSDMPKWWATS